MQARPRSDCLAGNGGASAKASLLGLVGDSGAASNLLSDMIVVPGPTAAPTAPGAAPNVVALSAARLGGDMSAATIDMI
jgi:hypothetical protein